MTSFVDKSGISDQAITTYIWVVYNGICQIINIFGIVTNIINIICFVKQGFKESVNISLLGLSVCDLCSLITVSVVCVLINPAIMTADLPFDPFEAMYLTSGTPHISFTRVSSCITAMITLERCLCIVAPLKIKSIITPDRTAIITVCIFLVCLCTSAPVYAVNRLGLTFSPLRNKTLVAIISTENREKVEKITFIINNFSIPLCAFVIIVVSTIILSFKLWESAKWRQKTNTSAHVDKVSSRNQRTSQMVVMISILFIVCFLPVSIFSLVVAYLPELSIRGTHLKITVIVCGLGYTMESINSSMNIFIYYYMSRNYRDNFNSSICSCWNVPKKGI